MKDYLYIYSGTLHKILYLVVPEVYGPTRPGPLTTWSPVEEFGNPCTAKEFPSYTPTKRRQNPPIRTKEFLYHLREYSLWHRTRRKYPLRLFDTLFDRLRLNFPLSLSTRPSSLNKTRLTRSTSRFRKVCVMYLSGSGRGWDFLRLLS